VFRRPRPTLNRRRRKPGWPLDKSRAFGSRTIACLANTPDPELDKGDPVVVVVVVVVVVKVGIEAGSGFGFGLSSPRRHGLRLESSSPVLGLGSEGFGDRDRQRDWIGSDRLAPSSRGPSSTMPRLQRMSSWG